MPELVEKLLEYLDEISILSIVGVKLLTVEVLKTASGTSKRFKPKPLGKLIRKALGFGQPQTLEEERTKVQRISRTLLAQLGSPQPLLQEFLDVICAEHKYVKGRLDEDEYVIRMSCPLHTYHSVSAQGFILLEDCEGAIGSTEQRIRKIELSSRSYHYYNPIWGGADHIIREALLLALVSRVTRQLVAVETLTWYNDTLEVDSKDQALVLNALLQRCDRVLNVQTVKVCGEIQMEGWEALAKALMKHPCHAKAIFSSKKRMLQARREDLRTIWEAMPGRLNGVHSSWVVEGRDTESKVHMEKKFNKASAELKGLEPRRSFVKAGQKSEQAWTELLEFLDEPEPEEASRRLRSGRELGDS